MTRIVWPSDYRIIEMINSGMRLGDIARTIGCSKDAACRHIRHYGLRYRATRQRQANARPFALNEDERKIVVSKTHYTIDGREKTIRISLPRVSFLSGWEGATA